VVTDERTGQKYPLADCELLLLLLLLLPPPLLLLLSWSVVCNVCIGVHGRADSRALLAIAVGHRSVCRLGMSRAVGKLVCMASIPRSLPIRCCASSPCVAPQTR